MFQMFRAIWAFRSFIVASVKSEIKGRFARSSIGAAWFILHPLAQATIYSLVLSELLASKLPGITNKAGYAVYLMAGMAAWGLFSEVLTRCTTVFIDFASPMKKIALPRLCLPIIVGGSALLNHVLLLAAMTLVFSFFGILPGLAWLNLLIGASVLLLLGYGLGVLIGVFNVFARDVGQVVSVVMPLWFWLTPIVYPATVIPEDLRWLVNLNPMVPVVRIYHDAILLNKAPEFAELAYPIVLAATLVLLSFTVFRRASAELVDVL